MSLFDALRRGADNYPGSRPVLSLRIGKNDEVTRKELSGATTHKLGAVAGAVQGLPEKHRHALNWLYVKPTSPRRACAALAVSMHDLFDLVVSGRQMLINRGV